MSAECVWVVVMFTNDRMYRHNLDTVFRTLDGAKAAAIARLKSFDWTPRPGVRWFDAPDSVSNYTDDEGERWVSIFRNEIV